MAEKLFYVGVKALIRNREGKILLLKSSLRNHTKDAKPYWDIPGGRIEEGGDETETLKREIEEETGVSEISDLKFMTAVISNHQIAVDENRTAGLVLMVYSAKIDESAHIHLSPEHTEYEWVAADVAAERLVNKYPPEFTNTLK